MLAHGWQTIPERGVVMSREPFKFWWELTISAERLKLEWSNFASIQAMSSPSIRMTKTVKMGVVRVTWPTLNFDAPSNISGTAEARIVKFCMQIDGIKS